MALNALVHLLLLLLVGGLAWFDARACRVPNRVTFLLAAAGLLLNFPGEVVTWAACLALFWSYRLRLIGGGDAKLWLALMWLVPPTAAADAVLAMGMVLAGTGALQIAWRFFHGRAVFGVRSPGAWRALPFAFWMFLVGS